LNFGRELAMDMVATMFDRFDRPACSWKYGFSGKYENEQHIGMILEGLHYATNSLQFRNDDPVFMQAAQGLSRRVFTPEGSLNSNLLINTNSTIKALPQTLLVARLFPHAFETYHAQVLLTTILDFKNKDFFTSNIRLQSYCARAVSYWLIEKKGAEP
jgi:hypothetical protein